MHFEELTPINNNAARSHTVSYAPHLRLLINLTLVLAGALPRRALTLVLAGGVDATPPPEFFMIRA